MNVQHVAATSNNSSTRATERRFVARSFNKLPKVEHVQVLATSRQDRIFDEKSVQLVASNRQLVEQTFNLLPATGNLLPETSNLLKQQATSCSFFQLVASNKQLVARQQVAFNKSTVWTGLYRRLTLDASVDALRRTHPVSTAF